MSAENFDSQWHCAANCSTGERDPGALKVWSPMVTTTHKACFRHFQ